MKKKLYLIKLLAFLKKDFYIASSYKLGFILGIIGSLFPIFSYFFINKLMIGHHPQSLEKYGGDYFSFTLIGVAFSGYFMLAVAIFSGEIRRAQMAGCLEAMLSSQTSSRSIVVMSSIYSFISAAVMLTILILIANIFLGFSFAKMNFLSTFVTFLLSLLVFIGLGIFAAAGTVIFKQGDPFSFIFGGLSSLLGGAVFPIAVLPAWLQTLSCIVPITYSLDALRLSILQGYTIIMLKDQLAILFIMALILFPLSIKFFEWAIEKGKKDGTLMQY